MFARQIGTRWFKIAGVLRNQLEKRIWQIDKNRYESDV